MGHFSKNSQCAESQQDKNIFSSRLNSLNHSLTVDVQQATYSTDEVRRLWNFYRLAMSVSEELCKCMQVGPSTEYTVGCNLLTDQSPSSCSAVISLFSFSPSRLSITPSLLHSRLKTCLFNNIFTTVGCFGTSDTDFMHFGHCTNQFLFVI